MVNKRDNCKCKSRSKPKSSNNCCKNHCCKQNHCCIVAQPADHPAQQHPNDNKPSPAVEDPPAVEPAPRLTNGDYELYAEQNHIATYKKGLLQDRNDPSIGSENIKKLRQYLADKNFAGVKAILKTNLIDPFSALFIEDEYKDLCKISRIPPPVDSEDFALCMLEVYLMCLMRDVPFSEWNNIKLYTDFIEKHPTYDMRGTSKSDKKGYYISQFLLVTIPFWCAPVVNKIKFYKNGQDFLDTVEKYEDCHFNGKVSTDVKFEETARYCINGRDLAHLVHKDAAAQFFIYAATLLFVSYPKAFIGPYAQYSINGFVDFGRPCVEHLVTKASVYALRVAWHYKWQEHLFLRPEEAGYYIEKGLLPVDPIIKEYGILDAIKEKYGSYCLPTVYPEGSPTHPSFQSGHACIAGACITILKAFFNENYAMDLKVPNEDGSALVDVVDHKSTIGDELNKLATDVGVGRDWAGVHYRFDAIMGIECGEDVAIRILQQYLAQTNSDHIFKFTKYNGEYVEISK